MADPMILRMTDASNFSYRIYGFTITQGPPAPAGVDEYAVSPTTPFVVDRSPAVAARQVVVMNSAKPAARAMLRFIPNSGAQYRGGSFWSIVGDAKFEVDLRKAADFQLVFDVHDEIPTSLTLTVNGRVVERTQKSNVDDWRDVAFDVPSDATVEGVNTLLLGVGDGVVLMRTATFVPQVVATIRWRTVLEGSIRQGGSVRRTKSIERGTTDTTTETTSFAAAIGVQVGIEPQTLFMDMNAQLNLDFTRSTQHETSIETSEISTEETELSVVCPDDARSLTYQFWQPVFTFNCLGQPLIQLLDEPIVQMEYPEPLP